MKKTFTMKLPTVLQCYELFDKYKVPGTVRIHCEMVHKVAISLAEQLNKKGCFLDLNIIKPFSLLHDFMKAVVLEHLSDPPYNYQPSPEELTMHQQLRKQFAGMSETQAAFRILKDKYPDFAKFFLESDNLTCHPQAIVHEETHFIHYIDWRVLGNKVVPLSERMDYIYRRYGHWIKQKGIDWEAVKQGQFNYERKIFSYLPFSPEQLGMHLTLNHG